MAERGSKELQQELLVYKKSGEWLRGVMEAKDWVNEAGMREFIGATNNDCKEKC